MKVIEKSERYGRLLVGCRQPLGLRPGTHLRVIETTTSADGDEVEGSLADLPELEQEDFERASELARGDLSGA